MSKPRWVVKSNELVNARYDWDILQQRMIMMMIAQLRMDQEDFGNQVIDVSQMKDLSHARSNAYNAEVADAATRLRTEPVYIKMPSGKWREYNLLSYVQPDGGCIIARFNPDMKPLLLNLKERFTKYLLENVMRFQSKYSSRVYELCKQVQQKDGYGFRRIPVAELREILAIETKYKRFSNLTARVLEPTKEEINSLTDIEIEYTVIRSGNTPTAVVYKISPNARIIEGRPVIPQPTQQEEQYAKVWDVYENLPELVRATLERDAERYTVDWARGADMLPFYEEGGLEHPFIRPIYRQALFRLVRDRHDNQDGQPDRNGEAPPVARQPGS